MKFLGIIFSTPPLTPIERICESIRSSPDDWEAKGDYNQVGPWGLRHKRSGVIVSRYHGRMQIVYPLEISSSIYESNILEGALSEWTAHLIANNTLPPS